VTSQVGKCVIVFTPVPLSLNLAQFNRLINAFGQRGLGFDVGSLVVNLDTVDSLLINLISTVILASFPGGRRRY
jgi:hypothetical protein